MMAEMKFTRCLLELPKVSVNDIRSVVWPSSTTPCSKLNKDFKFYVSSFLCNFEDLIEVPVHPGDDVTLSCQAADPSIRAVKWTRPDLEPTEYVLYCSDGHLDSTCQHPSFKDRVELVDRDLKDGNVSLILKNVSSIDNGIYECGVAPASSRRKKRACEPISTITTITTIRLQVPEPAGSNSGHSEDGNSSHVGRDRYRGLAAGVTGVLVLVVVAAAVVGVLMYKRRKKKRSGQPADDDDDEASADNLV